jgi:hypothetical protein
MPRSSPQLPTDFVAGLLKQPFMNGFISLVQVPSFDEVRFSMTDLNQLGMVDNPVAVRDAPLELQAQLGLENRRTYLHVGAMVGDPILVCEMIRLGASVDITDASGKTPLFLAVESVARWTVALDTGVDPFVTRILPKGPSMKRTHPVRLARKDGLLRLHYIVRIFLEQHADPKCASEGFTPLHTACKFKFWDLIELLLKYGADPLPPRLPGSTVPAPPTFFRTPADKARFRALVHSTANSPRPPRMCPCFSGKMLAACHDAEAKPFPLDFLCRCGSQKVHNRCCRKRKFVSFERWDEAQQFIMPCEARSMPFPISEEQDKNLKEKLGIIEDVSEELGSPITRPSGEECSVIARMYADGLLSQGLIDPAFAWAMKRVDFVPRFSSCLLLTLHPNVVFTGRKVEHAVDASWHNFSAPGTT